MSRGIQRERDLVNLLRDEGWWSIRSPASKGNVDVVAIKRQMVASVGGPPRWAHVRFYEVKSTAAGPFHSFGPADRESLSGAAQAAGAVAILCWWPPRKQPTFIPEEEWPR